MFLLAAMLFRRSWILTRCCRQLLSSLVVVSSTWIVCGYGVSYTDHCLNESFNASCPDKSVVLVTEARFGRMRPGRCIGGAFNVGCSKDIKYHLDALCTAKPRCDISIRDLVDLHPCQRDFVSYLEASYKCIEVSGLDDATPCPPSGHVRLYGKQDGYLAWTSTATGTRTGSRNGQGVTANSRVGSDRCPWTIIAEPGQRINLTVVVVLNGPTPSVGNSQQTPCSGVVNIVAEQPTPTTGSHVVARTDACSMVAVTAESDASQQPIKRQMLTSTGHVLQVYISSPDGDTVANNAGFTILLRYAGCATPQQLPVNAVMERVSGDTNRLIVKCNNKSSVETTWYLTCHEGRWLGLNDLNNCTTSSSPIINKTASLVNVTLPEVRPSTSARQYKITVGLAWAVAVGVVLGMFAGLLLLLSVHCVQRAIYSPTVSNSLSRDDVTSQSDERYSFWRESNRQRAGYQSTVTQEMMTSSQREHREGTQTSTCRRTFNCAPCLGCYSTSCDTDATVNSHLTYVAENAQIFDRMDSHQHVNTSKSPAKKGGKRQQRSGGGGSKKQMKITSIGGETSQKPTVDVISDSDDVYCRELDKQAWRQFWADMSGVSGDSRAIASADIGSWPVRNKMHWHGVTADQLVLLDYRPGIGNTVCVHRSSTAAADQAQLPPTSDNTELVAEDNEQSQRMNTTWRPVDLLETSETNQYGSTR